MKILVIDAYEDSAELLALLLEQNGHRVYSCTDPVEGLRTALAVQPDLVLLGGAFPAMGGYRLAVQLRAMTGLSKLRMIMLTGLAPDAKQLQNCGIERHFLKPLDLDALLEVIETGAAVAVASYAVPEPVA